MRIFWKKFTNRDMFYQSCRQLFVQFGKYFRQFSVSVVSKLNYEAAVFSFKSANRRKKIVEHDRYVSPYACSSFIYLFIFCFFLFSRNDFFFVSVFKIRSLIEWIFPPENFCTKLNSQNQK